MLSASAYSYYGPIISVQAATVAAAFVLYNLLASLCGTRKNQLVAAPSLFGVNQTRKDVSGQSATYSELHADNASADVRKNRAQEMVNQYYDLATDFYEFGWGQSFHFAKRFLHESLAESILRHEYYLASRLGLRERQAVLDVGCGVGGPARNISRFSGANVTGITLNEYQVQRGNAKAAAEGLASSVRLVQGDFMALPFKPATFDAAYAIEATCHAPDRAACFKQIFKALKPGGVFGGYEWVTTAAFNSADPVHLRIKKDIEVGDGLPDITDGQAVVTALRKAGFVVEEVRDLALESAVPWYAPFAPAYTLSGFKTTPVGIFLTHAFVILLETIRLAPAGTTKMHSHLIAGARGLYAGGVTGTFTPMLFFLARKPSSSAEVEESPISAKKSTSPVQRRRSQSRSRK